MHGAPVAVCLLDDDPHELTSSRIADRPREPTVGDHTHDVEVLDVDHLVLANQRQSLLVVMVASGTRYVSVRDGGLAPRLFPVRRSFLSAGLLPLQPPQLAQLAAQIFRILDVRARSVGGGDRRQPANAHIHPGFALLLR